MSDETDIELAKLQYADRQANRDFWKWVVMGIGLGLNPLVPVVTSYIEHRAIASVDAKATVAATKAAIVEKKTDAIAKDTASTNAINTEWKAARTGDPADMAKAERAEAKVMAQAAPK